MNISNPYLRKIINLLNPFKLKYYRYLNSREFIDKQATTDRITNIYNKYHREYGIHLVFSNKVLICLLLIKPKSEDNPSNTFKILPSVVESLLCSIEEVQQTMVDDMFQEFETYDIEEVGEEIQYRLDLLYHHIKDNRTLYRQTTINILQNVDVKYILLD